MEGAKYAGDDGGRCPCRHRARHLQRRRTGDQRVSGVAVSWRSVRRARLALQQHRRQRRRGAGRTRIQAVRAERDDQPEGSVGPRGDRRGGGSAAAGPRGCDRRRRDGRDLRHLLSRARSVRRHERRRRIRRFAGAVQPIATGLRDGRRRLRAVADPRRLEDGATARSSAPLRRARTARSMPGLRIRSRSSARCRSRSRTPGCVASDVDVVYASANATARLDEVEARALVTLFGGSRTIVTSIKGAIGECGASGAAACVAAVLCGAAGRVPPIAGLRDADPIARPLRLADANAQAPGEIVLVNSVASGGARGQRRAADSRRRRLI